MHTSKILQPNAAVSGRTARRSASRSVRCTAKFSASWLPRGVERFVVARCIVRCRQSSRVDRAPARVVDAVGRMAGTTAGAWSNEGGHAASKRRTPLVAAGRGARRDGRRAKPSRVARTPSTPVEATAFATATVGDPFTLGHGRGVRITLPFTCGGPSDRRERGPAAGETAC